MSKNMVELEGRQMEIWRRVACWVSKATHAQPYARPRVPTHIHTHPHTQIRNIYCLSTATVVLWTRLSIIRIMSLLLVLNLVTRNFILLTWKFSSYFCASWCVQPLIVFINITRFFQSCFLVSCCFSVARSGDVSRFLGKIEATI
jgi:hypothetical protein